MPLAPDRRDDDEHTRQVVKLTVGEIFDGLGIDLSTPEGRQRFRENNQFLNEWRAGSASIKKAGWYAAGSTFLGGLIWLLTHGLDALPKALSAIK